MSQELINKLNIKIKTFEVLIKRCDKDLKNLVILLGKKELTQYKKDSIKANISIVNDEIDDHKESIHKLRRRISKINEE